MASTAAAACWARAHQPCRAGWPTLGLRRRCRRRRGATIATGRVCSVLLVWQQTAARRTSGASWYRCDVSAGPNGPACPMLYLMVRRWEQASRRRGVAASPSLSRGTSRGVAGRDVLRAAGARDGARGGWMAGCRGLPVPPALQAQPRSAMQRTEAGLACVIVSPWDRRATAVAATSPARRTSSGPTAATATGPRASVLQAVLRQARWRVRGRGEAEEEGDEALCAPYVVGPLAACLALGAGPGREKFNVPLIPPLCTPSGHRTLMPRADSPVGVRCLADGMPRAARRKPCGVQ